MRGGGEERTARGVEVVMRGLMSVGFRCVRRSGGDRKL